MRFTHFGWRVNQYSFRCITSAYIAYDIAS